MKKFAFNLERMLGFQEQNLETEKGVLGKLTAAMDGLKEDQDKLQAHIVTVQRDIALRETQGTTAFILKGCYTMLESARMQLEDVKAELTRVQARVERQRTVVTDASKEVKKLEKLKEKRWEEYCYSEAKEQQNIIAEHVAGEFVRHGVS